MQIISFWKTNEWFNFTSIEVGKIKRLTKILLLILLILYYGYISIGSLHAKPDISADGAALMDLNSGRVIYVKNPDKKLPMASTTKIMTGIIALEKENLDVKVKASEEASKVTGSSIYLKKGEKLSMEDILYGLLLESGNDAAHAISEHISGNLDNFSRLMNLRARKLGAVSTNFRNPHGLPSKNHYTTSKDLLKITAHALSNPVFARIVATKEKIIPGPDEEIKFRFLRNSNKLFNKYPGSDGVKTGWTKKAGRCISFSASKDGVQLVGTLLNAPEMYEDAKELLDWGFTNYETVTLLKKNQFVDEIQVEGSKDKVQLISSKDLVLPLKDSEKSKISYLIKPEDTLTVPIGSGEHVADLEVIVEGDVVDKVPLKAFNDIKKPGFWNRIIRVIQGIFSRG